MTVCDALIVGGGPAGSTCAGALRRAGWNVVVMDRARFPRDKVCGGWLTPRVLALLRLSPAEYRDAGLLLQEIAGFRTSVMNAAAVETRYPRVVSYAIRRCEFDAFLLRRADVRVLEHTPLATLERNGATWIANGELRTPLVIGAGGHFCPVARRLRERADVRPVVAKEAEFRLEGAASTVSGDTPELFFCRDLDGYGWCVRKHDYLNIGLGRRSNVGFAEHLREFAAFVERTGRAPGASRVRWRGHAYLASGAGPFDVVDHGMLLVGDAAGVAYPESGEGIAPAIESALLAARTLVEAGGAHAADDLLPYQDLLRRRHPVVREAPPITRTVMTAAGRALLRSSAFTRRVVLDRWFLRTSDVDGLAGLVPA